MQDVSMDFSYTNKPLIGQLQFPVAVARGEGKVDIKCKFAKMGAKVINDLMFGGTVTAGGQKIVMANVSTAAAASVTITPPASGVFYLDQGVLDHNGNEMILSTTAPAVGSYEVNNTTGAYTFNAAESGTLQISYVYTAASGGFNVAIPNKAMGNQPVVSLWVSNNNWGSNLVFNFPNCIFTKLGIPMKNTDWDFLDMEMAAFSDATANVAYMYSDS